MNNHPKPGWKVTINAVAAAGVLLTVAGLIWIMYHYTSPGPVDQARGSERAKNLAELNAQNKELLENYGWLNQARGVVRLPIERAMDLAVREWQNPAAGRSNLLARLEKALPPVPVTAPATNAPTTTVAPAPIKPKP